jgi:hypothetical protein
MEIGGGGEPPISAAKNLVGYGSALSVHFVQRYASLGTKARANAQKT